MRSARRWCYAKGSSTWGPGGSDFVAQYGKNNGGASGWKRDTSGSTQALEIMGDQLIVGGHFFEVGDQPGDKCGKGRPGDTDGQGNPVLDPNEECERRQGIAAYSFGGALDPDWNPKYSGRLQSGVGAARRGEQAAHGRGVQDGQRGDAELLRAVLLGYPVEGSTTGRLGTPRSRRQNPRARQGDLTSRGIRHGFLLDQRLRPVLTAATSKGLVR